MKHQAVPQGRWTPYFKWNVSFPSVTFNHALLDSKAVQQGVGKHWLEKAENGALESNLLSARSYCQSKILLTLEKFSLV